MKAQSRSYIEVQVCMVDASYGRPNILWLSIEDASPHLGCYGDPYASTQKALPVLVAILDEGSQWARVQASNVLDEIDNQASARTASVLAEVAFQNLFITEQILSAVRENSLAQFQDIASIGKS